MESELIKENENKLSSLKDKHKQIKINKLNHQELIKIYLSIKERTPYIKSVNINIMKLLAHCWPEGKAAPEIFELISFSDQFIRHMLDDDEIQEIGYNEIYKQAYGKCKEHLENE